MSDSIIYLIISLIFVLVVASPFVLVGLAAALTTGRVVASPKRAIVVGGLVGVAALWIAVFATVLLLAWASGSITDTDIDVITVLLGGLGIVLMSLPVLPLTIASARLGNLYRPERSRRT